MRTIVRAAPGVPGEFRLMTVPLSDEGQAPTTARADERGACLDGRGRGRFVLRIGPASVSLCGQLDPLAWPLDAAHHRFLLPAATPDLLLHVRHEPIGAPSGTPAFRAGEVATFYRDGTRWGIRLPGGGGTAQADRMVSLDPSGRIGTLVLDVDQSPDLAAIYPMEYPLEDLVFRHLFADRGALLVHACGVAWQGKGYLFVGSSGAGKSTMARLWKETGATVLNDDRVVLEASEAEIFVYPTPWFGEYPEVGGEGVPLAALYFLRKGSEVSFERLRPAGAAALAFAKAFPPFWDPERMARTLETLERACRETPCGWLTVPPDQRAVTWVQAHR